MQLVPVVHEALEILEKEVLVFVQKAFNRISTRQRERNGMKENDNFAGSRVIGSGTRKYGSGRGFVNNDYIRAAFSKITKTTT